MFSMWTVLYVLYESMFYLVAKGFIKIILKNHPNYQDHFQIYQDHLGNSM